MNVEMTTILEAYQMMSKPKVKEVNKTIVKEETSTDSTSATSTSAVSGGKEEVKEAGEVASEPGNYVGFTGKIRTPGVFGTVENATFTIDDSKNVSWSKGTWLDGTWSGRGSFWNGGTWKNGTWKTGYWGGGVWENGIHQGGIFAGGTWKNGTWDFGVFDEGVWEDGIWKDGDWAKDDTKWIKGRDSKGEEHTDAPFHWGGMKYSKVTDPSKAAIDREKSRYNKGEYTQGTAGIDTFDDDDDPGKTYGNVGFKAGMKKADINITDSVKKHITSPIFKQIVDSLQQDKIYKVDEDSTIKAILVNMNPIGTELADKEPSDEMGKEYAKLLQNTQTNVRIEFKKLSNDEFNPYLMKIIGTKENIIKFAIDILNYETDEDLQNDIQKQLSKDEDEIDEVSESTDSKEKLLEMIDKMSDEDIEKLSEYVEETYFKI